MQSELKQCPFCSEQCATLVIDQGDKWAHYEPSCLEVRTGYDLSDDAAWRAEAITAWNTRASDAEITRLTQALRAAEERERVLREKWAELHNTCNIVGSPSYVEALRAASEAARIARAALKGPSHD